MKKLGTVIEILTRVSALACAGIEISRGRTLDAIFFLAIYLCLKASAVTKVSESMPSDYQAMSRADAKRLFTGK